MTETSIELSECIKRGIDQMGGSTDRIITKSIIEHLTNEMVGRCAASGVVLYTNSEYTTVESDMPTADYLNFDEEFDFFNITDEEFRPISKKVAIGKDIESKNHLTYIHNVGASLYTAEQLYLTDISTGKTKWDTWAKALLEPEEYEATNGTFATSLLLWCNDTDPDHQLVDCKMIWDRITEDTQKWLKENPTQQLKEVIVQVEPDSSLSVDSPDDQSAETLNNRPITDEEIDELVERVTSAPPSAKLDQFNKHETWVYEIINNFEPIGGGDIHDVYQQIVDEPRTKRTIRNYLNKLKDDRLIEEDGNTRGKEYTTAR